MKTVAFIPIKMNNERTPGKNTKRFYNGKCILEIIQETLMEVKGLDEVYVFCSNDAIKEYIIDGVKFLKRPEFLDTKTATPNDIINEFMKLVDADIYMVSHATSPFVSVEHFEECINAVVSGEYDSSLQQKKFKSYYGQRIIHHLTLIRKMYLEHKILSLYLMKYLLHMCLLKKHF